MPRKRPRLNPTVPVDLAEMRHRPLNDTAPNANVAHQPPIAMNRPVLAQCRVPQIHGAESNLTRHRPEIPLVGTTCPNPRLAAAQPLVLSVPPRQIDSPFQPQTAQVGLTAFSMASDSRASRRANWGDGLDIGGQPTYISRIFPVHARRLSPSS